MVARASRMTPPMEYVRLYEEAAGLDGVIAIHSTRADRLPAAAGSGLTPTKAPPWQTLCVWPKA